MARGGKYWNLGLSDRSRLGATDAQLRYIKSLTTVDHRGAGLTQGEASELIEKSLGEFQERRKGLSDMADQLFTSIMRRAVEAANRAGEEWLARHKTPLFVMSTPEGLEEVHGKIGYAYLTAPKSGSGLYKWVQEHGLDDRRNRKALQIHHRYTERMEGDLHVACCIAALNELMDASGEIGDVRLVFHCDDPDYSIAA